MENLLNCKGLRFSAKTRLTGRLGYINVSGVIQIENGNVYLCQNSTSDGDCSDKLGYSGSWRVGIGAPEDLALLGIQTITIYPRPSTPAEIESYKDWQVGDEITDGSQRWAVIFRSGELVACKNISTGYATSNYTCDKLHEDGFRLRVDSEEIQPKPTEITMDQIAEKFGVPVGELKIKKD